VLAVMAGGEAASVRLPLAFLGEGRYEALMVRDVVGNPAAVRVERALLEPSGSLTIAMPRGGGFVARFTRR
jgi:alpha-glucosidase